MFNFINYSTDHICVSDFRTLKIKYIRSDLRFIKDEKVKPFISVMKTYLDDLQFYIIV